MHRAVREFEEHEIAPEHMLEAVWDVAAYPDFVAGVQGVEVLEDDGSEARALFTAGLLGMRFRYTLRCVREPDEVRWERIEGDFQDAGGLLRHLGDGHYRYENALDPGFRVPGFAVKMVLEKSLPGLIEAFRARARVLASG